MHLSNRFDWRLFQQELATIDHPTGLNPFEIRFCLMYGSGQYRYAAQAYRECLSPAEGDLMTDGDVTRLTNKTLLRPAVRKYLSAIMKKLETCGIATIHEVQMYLTEVFRTPIDYIDGQSPFCQKKTIKTHVNKAGEETETVTIESVNKMDAIKTLSTMKGWNAPTKHEVTHAGGVMMVPMSAGLDAWTAEAGPGQAALMDDAINI